MGTIIIDSSGRRTNVSADINAAPNEGNVLEGWLVDEGSGYKLSLGQFRNGTLDFSQYMVNPYTYNNFEVTEEPAEDADPNAPIPLQVLNLKLLSVADAIMTRIRFSSTMIGLCLFLDCSFCLL